MKKQEPIHVCEEVSATVGRMIKNGQNDYREYLDYLRDEMMISQKEYHQIIAEHTL